MSNNLKLGLIIGAAMDSSVARSLRGFKQETVSLGKRVQETNKRISAVQEAKRYTDRLSQLKQKQDQAGGSSKLLAAEISYVEKRYREAKKQVESYGFEVSNLEKTEKSLLKQQRINSQELEKKSKKESGSGSGSSFRQNLSTGITGVVGFAGGVLAMGKEFSGRAEEVVETAKALGMTSQALQEYQILSDRAGVSQEVFNKSAITMVDTVSKAAIGKGKGVTALQELGVDAKALNALNPEQQIEKISDALSKVKNQNDRVRLASALFGKGAGADMLRLTRIVGVGTEALEKQRAEMRASGAILSEEMLSSGNDLDDKIDDAELAFIGLTNTLNAAMAPALGQVLGKFVEFTNDHGPEIQAMGTVLSSTFSALGTVLGGVFDVLEMIGTSIGESLGWLESKTGIFSEVADLVSGGEAANVTVPVDQLPLQPQPLNAIATPKLASKSNSVTNTTHAPISIHPTPNQSPKDIAAEVRAELDKRDKQQSRQQRGALYDDSGFAPAS